MTHGLYNEILSDTETLIRRAANPRKNTIALSRGTAALLDTIRPPDPTAPLDPLPHLAATPERVQSSATPEAHRQITEPLTDRVAALAELAAEVSSCTKCGLCNGRTQTVFADGSPNAEIVFVGEAPGFHEDQQGVPFVGQAGRLLTDIITKGMKLRREDVYICNVIKCRPPDNRDPAPDEKKACEPYLVRQLELIRPKVICALGGHAAKTLLKTDEATNRLRGKWHSYQGIPLRVTYHPAYLLRNPADKRKTWEDIQEIMKLLNGEALPGRAETSLFK